MANAAKQQKHVFLKVFLPIWSFLSHIKMPLFFSGIWLFFFSMLSSIVKCISAAVVILPPFSEKGGIQKHPTKIIQHNQEGQELQLELGFVKGSSSLHGFASSCRGPTLGGPTQHSMFLWPLVQFLFQCPHSSHARQVFFIHLVGHIKHIFGLAKTLQFKIWQFKDIL